MSLSQNPFLKGPYGFPRSRGDEPVIRQLSNLRRSFSPLTRG